MKNTNILLAIQNPNRIQSQLKTLGYQITGVVQSSDEAIRNAEQRQPDVVLLDIRIRGERYDGFEAAKQIRKRLNIPVVYLIPDVNPSIVQHVNITSPFDYILIPLAERELHLIVELALYKHRTQQTLQDSERCLETARKQLDKVQKQIRKQQKELQTLPTVTRDITHQFRNSLMPIAGLSEVLLNFPENLDNRERVTDYLQKILTAAQEATGVVNQMRDFYYELPERIAIPCVLDSER